MPLTLATSLRTFVTSSSRSRGEAYFRAGRVIPRRADATSFNAAVSGTRSYDVSLLVDGDRLTATSYIQRINTVGGLAPAAQDCDAGTAGQQREIPYSADYVFFKETGR